MSQKKYLFIDRDGTLIEEPDDKQIDSIEKFKLLPDLIPSLISLKQAGYTFVMVSNQDGLGTEANPSSAFQLIQTLLIDILGSQGIQFESVRICPHLDADRCTCRKPMPGLLLDFVSMPDLDRTRSFVIGDREADVSLAKNIGISAIRLGQDNGWKAISRQILSIPRRGSATRNTKETQISARVYLDESPPTRVSTGIGFFDHMLEQISHHGSFGLEITTVGDTHVDDHHTIEDTAIALGTALRQALGDKVGIERFGFYLPMDDSSAQVALDLSGRNFLRFEGRFTRESVGGMSTEMIPHFFRSFSDALGATLHIKVDGDNTHHQIESIFKAVGRSLKLAIQQTSSGLPSTKGIL